jgi:hypothetical protein
MGYGFDKSIRRGLVFDDKIGAKASGSAGR